MTQENAYDFLYQCMLGALKNVTDTDEPECVSFPYTVPRNAEEVRSYLSDMYYIYKDVFSPECASGCGYILNLERLCEPHPSYILVTLYSLLIADADIYIIYAGSYYDAKKSTDFLNCFLDEFTGTYQKAEKLLVSEELTYSLDVFIEQLRTTHKDINHLVCFGDYINFYPDKKLLSDERFRVHLPAAHYVIENYSSDTISPHDRQLLFSFGRKCYSGYIDYAAYVSENNKHNEYYGFDIDVMYADIAVFNTFKDYKGRIDKAVAVIFTDKDKSELNYPKELYECFDVYFSKEYNDNILNYDFSQLYT